VSRSILVTGASRGIGAAVARRFARAGDRVALHCSTGRSRPLAEGVVADLPDDGHLVVTADLADPEAVERAVQRVRTAFGRLDVVVNNAGVFVAHPPLTASYADWQAAWRATLDVNLLGAANVAYLAARHMVADGVRGRIVNVGSRGAFRGEPEAPAYGASKAALHALGQSLALALAPHGIAVASVAPGFVETDMAAPVLDGAGGDAVRAQSPFGRVARPEEVADAVFWLASPESEWASGAVLDLNGASHLR